MTKNEALACTVIAAAEKKLTEVYQDLMYALGDLLEKGAGDHLVRGVLAKINGNKELLSLLIDIADINTTLVSEEDPITLSENVSILIARRRKLRTKPQIMLQG